MAIHTSASIDALAEALARILGTTPEEAVAFALRAELDREAAGGAHRGTLLEPSVEELLAKIRSFGPWQGPTGAALQDELYGPEGLPR